MRESFTYHAPHGTQPERYQMLRAKALEMANDIIALTPAGREQSLAITNLEQSIMWANKAIAVGEANGQ